MRVIPDFLPDADPNAVGEFLRDIFFDQKNGQRVGCYSTFDLRTGVIYKPDDIREFGEVWTHAEYENVHMYYYWEGDGTLEFHLPNGRIYVNNDCKKNNRWEVM